MGRPVFAQMIGQDIGSLVRTAKELLKYPVAGIDLNLGCPAPVVCRKDAGGGLLRYPERIEAIVGALRELNAVQFFELHKYAHDCIIIDDALGLAHENCSYWCQRIRRGRVTTTPGATP